MADDPFSAIGSGLGALIGGENASGAVGSGVASIDGLLTAGAGSIAPYNVEGASQIPQLDWQLGHNNVIGDQRLTSYNPAPANATVAPNTTDFENFSKNFNMSDGAKYLMNTAETAQDNSAASKGGFYSGANMRAHDQISEGIANTDLLQQYQALLSGESQSFNQDLTGNQQNFSQRLTSDQQNYTQEQGAYKNLFDQETLGEKAGASQTLLAGAGASPLAGLFNSNANAQASKGTGIGSLVSGAIGLLTA